MENDSRGLLITALPEAKNDELMKFKDKKDKKVHEDGRIKEMLRNMKDATEVDRLLNSLQSLIIGLWADIREKAFAEEGALLEFKNTKVNDLGDYHFGLGMYLRNNILMDDSEIYLQFIENGVRGRDDMSAAIICLWHEALQNGEIE